MDQIDERWTASHGLTRDWLLCGSALSDQEKVVYIVIASHTQFTLFRSVKFGSFVHRKCWRILVILQVLR
jgi:hypothetical protein